MAKVTEFVDEGDIGEDGLTEHERMFLETPVSELDQNQRHSAIAIREKKDRHTWAENEKYRRAQEASKTKLK